MGVAYNHPHNSIWVGQHNFCKTKNKQTNSNPPPKTTLLGLSVAQCLNEGMQSSLHQTIWVSFRQQFLTLLQNTPVQTCKSAFGETVSHWTSIKLEKQKQVAKVKRRRSSYTLSSFCPQGAIQNQPVGVRANQEMKKMKRNNRTELITLSRSSIKCLNVSFRFFCFEKKQECLQSRDQKKAALLSC